MDNRARGKLSNNGGQGELRRPHGNVSTIDGSSSLFPAGAGNNIQNSAPPLNAMPSSASSNNMDYNLPVSRTDHIPYEYAFSSEAVNVPMKAQSNARLDPRLNEAIKNSKLSPLAKEFVPKTFVQGEAPAPSGSTVPSQLEYMVRLVQEFIYEVTLNPGKFEEEVILLTETLNVMVKSTDLTKALVEIIFKQAIQEPNFRYNGARLCNHLNRNLIGDSKGPNFRFLLLEKCQFEFEQRDMLIKSNPNYLRGLVFFLGELYSQILQQSGARLSILQNAIVCLLDTLLTEPSQENVKCVCQVMKMTGANLDDDEHHVDSAERKNVSTGLSTIFDKLKDLNSTGATRDLAPMVSNVIHLRSIDWGRSSVPIETQPPPPNVFSGGPVFYGPDGQPFTPEEELFLESQAFYDCRYDSYDDDFNDEIAADYESFLREMGQ